MYKGKRKNELTRNKRRKKSVTPVMVGLVMIIGFFVGIGSFSIGYNYMMADAEDEINTNTFSANDIAGQAQANLIGSDVDAVVTNINKLENGSSITFKNLKNDTTNIVNVTEKTIFPKAINEANIYVGDIFTYVFDKEKNLVELKECENAWTFNDIGARVNKTAKLIKFGSESKEHKDASYKYDENIISIRDKSGNSITLEKLSPLDTLKLTGYNNGIVDRVYSIQVVNGHGTVELKNINKIKNARVKIDNVDTTVSIGNPVLTLSEGTHTVLVTGRNISDIEKQVTVSEKTPAVLDLSNVVVSTGALTVYSNVEDYILYLNDKEYNEEESILLPYGEYKVIAQKDGYKTFTSTVTIDEDQNTLKVNMSRLKESGILSLNANPSEAEIYINDEYVGKGSVKVELALGSYIAKAVCDGYESQSKQINVSVDGQEISGSFDLKAK